MNHPPKYPSTFHFPGSPEVHRDDSMHQNPEIFLNVEVIITEKIDGSNVALKNGEVYARSTGLPSHNGWHAMVRQPTFRTYYGEDIFGIHSIEYDRISEGKTYRIFNIREYDTWLSWDDVVRLSADLDIDTVPVLFRGKFSKVSDISKWMLENIKNPSVIGPVREGFVIRWADSFNNVDFQQKVAKSVRKNHVQTSEHWTKNWRKAKLL